MGHTGRPLAVHIRTSEGVSSDRDCKGKKGNKPVQIDRKQMKKNALTHSRSAFNKQTITHELHIICLSNYPSRFGAGAELMTQDGDEGQRWK